MEDTETDAGMIGAMASSTCTRKMRSTNHTILFNYIDP